MQDVAQIVKNLGGNTALGKELGIAKNTISAWIAKNKMPRGWEKYLKATHPEAFGKGKSNDLE